MGDTTNFKVNADGSVTTIASGRKNLDPNEANILDIFRIEQAKGGVFASRRMKRRAMKYAKQANVPEYIVEKLMLDNYPNDLANYRRTTWLITWACAFLLFICGAIFCTFAVGVVYQFYSRSNERYENFRDRIPDRYHGSLEDMSQEYYREELNSLQDSRNDYLIYLLLWLSVLIGCIGVAGLCLRQYCKVKKKIIEQSTKTQN